MKIKYIILSLILIQFNLTLKVHAQDGGGIPPKAKAFLTVAGYGAGGGALLGLASMAFGTSPRAIAQGASLGLYAGLIFGTYVIVSHHQEAAGYTDPNSPYQEEGEEFYDNDDSSNPAPGVNIFSPSSSSGSMGSRITVSDRLAHAEVYNSLETKKASTLPAFTMQILNINF